MITPSFVTKTTGSSLLKLAPDAHVATYNLRPEMFIELYIFKAAFRVAFVTASDRYAGAARANKGLRLLWPALPPVTRWYLLRALF